MIAALHPVNALVLTYASLTLAKRSNAYWTTETDDNPVPGHPPLGAQTFAT